MEFGFRTGFQSQIEFLTMTNDFFYYRTHLVYLDRINDKILGLIPILIRCLLKAVRDFFNTIIQNIRKTDQHRSCHIPQLQLIDQLFQVDLNAVLTRSYHYMTFVIDTKVRSSPPCYVVEFFRIFNTPFSHFFFCTKSVYLLYIIIYSIAFSSCQQRLEFVFYPPAHQL